MEFTIRCMKVLTILFVVLLVSKTICGAETKEQSQKSTEISSEASNPKLEDLKAENSHGYGYYPGLGISHGYQLGYPAKQPYYPGFYNGYVGKPALSLGGYHNPAVGYSYGLGSGFGIGYPGIGYHGYNPGFVQPHGAFSPHSYPYVG